MAAMGRFRGGAAKIAVVGSALFGMISGSAVSNVLAVGIVTIPTMVRSGFTPYRAAAIESVGSTGGQLMPPVMGAAAFIMAEFLQVPYGAVCVAAAIPAFLYYACLFFHVDLEAAKHKIGAAKIAEAPAVSEVLKSGWHFLVPIALPRLRADVSGRNDAHSGKGRDRVDRHAHGAGDDLRLPRQAAGHSRHAAGDHGHRACLARHHPDRCRGRHHGRDPEHFRPRLQHDRPVARTRRRQCVPAFAADRRARLHSRHGPADGERLHPHRDLARPCARQARRHADGRAYVRDVQRHSDR